MELKRPPMQIELYDIEALTPYENNSRTHTPKQIRAIKKSIENFGFVAGAIAIRDGVLAKGHATLEAVKAIYKDGDDIYPAPGKKCKPKPKPFPKGQIPVIDCSGWSDQQFKAFVIADNRIAEQAGWDRAFLYEEIPTIEEPDLSDLLADIEIADLLAVRNMGGRFENVPTVDYTPDFTPSVDDEDDDDVSEMDEVANKGQSLRFPVSFILDGSEWAEWLEVKKAMKTITHKSLFMKALKKEVSNE